MTPDPSIERTVAGRPAVAAHGALLAVNPRRMHQLMRQQFSVLRATQRERHNVCPAQRVDHSLLASFIKQHASSPEVFMCFDAR